GREAEYPIARRYVGDPVADLVDDAGHLAPGCLGEVAAHHSAAHLPVDRVDGRRADRNADLAGPRMWIGQIDYLEHLGSAEAAELDRFHCLTPVVIQVYLTIEGSGVRSGRRCSKTTHDKIEACGLPTSTESRWANSFASSTWRGAWIPTSCRSASTTATRRGRTPSSTRWSLPYRRASRGRCPADACRASRSCPWSSCCSWRSR